MVELSTLVDFFQNYSYFAVLGILLLCGFGLPIPEDISLIAGGIISGLGFANPHIMVAVAMFGVLSGDSTVYTIGRVLGIKVLNSKFFGKIVTPARYESISSKLKNHGNTIIFAARFMPGLRSPIFMIAGITHFVSYTRFILIDGVAAIISVPLWVYVGYFGASRMDDLKDIIIKTKYGMFIVIAAIILFIVIMKFVKKKIKSEDELLKG